jgi:hypothetical protein
MENGGKPITQLSQLTVMTGDKGAAVPAVEKVAQFLPDSAAAAAAAAGAAKAKAQVDLTGGSAGGAATCGVRLPCHSLIHSAAVRWAACQAQLVPAVNLAGAAAE